MTWLDRVLAALRAVKTLPSPGSLAGPSAPFSLPISWEGWADHGGTGRGLTPLRMTAAAAADAAAARTAVTSVWVYACCQAIAGELSAARLLLKRRIGDEGEEDIENHPFERLWERPNPFMGRAFLMQFWTWNLLLRGEAYLYVRPVQGVLAEIWPIPSWMVEPIPHPDQFIAGYLFSPGQGRDPIVLAPRYVVYSRLPNPFDPRRGLSPLAAAMGAVRTDLAMRNWQTTYFSRENATPTGIITVPRDTLDADLARIRMELDDFFSSGMRRVGVARAGDLAWTPFDRSQKDSQFLEGREFSRTEITRAFGIPDGYWDKDATRANAEGAKATMLETAVWPKLVQLAEDLNAQIVPVWIGDPDVRVQFEDIRPRNVQADIAQIQAYAPFLTINETRVLAGYDPLPDYRGFLTVEELRRGAPMPMTVPDLEREEPAPASPSPASPSPVSPSDVEIELKRWQRKAIKAVRLGRSGNVPFTSAILPPDLMTAIRNRLTTATTPDAVKQAFARDVPDDLPDVDPDAVAALLDDTMADALAWARLVIQADSPEDGEPSAPEPESPREQT